MHLASERRLAGSSGHAERSEKKRAIELTSEQPQREELPKIHAGFFTSLLDLRDSTERLVAGSEVRDYQIKGVKKTADEMLSGDTEGVWEVGTGGGKTTMAMEFLARGKGKKLWMAPSNVALVRVMKDIKAAQAAGYCPSVQVLDAENGGFAKFDPSVEITILTGQMFVKDGRFMSLPRNFFSLVVVDEGHGFLGDQMSNIPKYFAAYRLYMTATPDNANKSVYQFVPHQYFRYSSDELVLNEGFPHWLLHRYEVVNEHLEKAKLQGDFLNVDGREGKVLNMPHRFSIYREIALKALKAGEKTLGFLPSVKTSREFVKMLIGDEAEGKPGDPEFAQYKDQIAHIDGSMSASKKEQIERDFKSGKLKFVCCKTLFNESIDVDDIKHVILGDLCVSPRVLLQRIGRGARKAKDKEALHVHDVVSCVRRARRGARKESSSRGLRPVTVAGEFGMESVADGEVLNGPKKGQVYDSESCTYVDRTTVTSQRVSFSERQLDLNMLQNWEHAQGVLEMFQQVTGVHAINLLTHPEAFAQQSIGIDDEVAGKKFDLKYADFHDAVEYFGLLERLREKTMSEILGIAQSVRSRAMSALGVKGKGEVKEKEPRSRDPFALGREKEMVTLCCKNDREHEIIAFRHILRCINNANPAATEIAIPLESFEKELGGAYACFYDCNRPENKSDSYDMTALCLMNNWFAYQDGKNIVIEIKKTREFWATEQRTKRQELTLKTMRNEGNRPRILGLVGAVNGYGERITLSDHAAKAIEAALERGEDSIFIENSDDLDRNTSDILAIMGMATYPSATKYNEGRMKVSAKNYPHVLLQVRAEENGWRVPIGHVRLEEPAASKNPQKTESAHLEMDGENADPFAPGREEKMICLDDDRGIRRKIYAEIIRRAGKKGKVTLSMVEIKELLGESDFYFSDLEQELLQPTTHSFPYFCLLNGWFATYSNNSLVVDTERTRQYWQNAEKMNPTTSLVLRKTPQVGVERPFILEVAKSDTATGAETIVVKSPSITLSEITAKAIIEAIAEGRNYVNICHENDLFYCTADILALMGVASYGPRGGGGKHLPERVDDNNRPKNFLRPKMVADGYWRVPIGHVQLDLEEQFEALPKQEEGNGDLWMRSNGVFEDLQKRNFSLTETWAKIHQFLSNPAKGTLQYGDMNKSYQVRAQVPVDAFETGGVPFEKYCREFMAATGFYMANRGMIEDCETRYVVLDIDFEPGSANLAKHEFKSDILAQKNPRYDQLLQFQRHQIAKEIPKFPNPAMQENWDYIAKEWIDNGFIAGPIRMLENDAWLPEFTSTLRLYGVEIEVGKAESLGRNTPAVSVTADFEGIMTGRPWKPGEPQATQEYPVSVPAGGMKFLKDLLVQVFQFGKMDVSFMVPKWNDNWKKSFEAFSKDVDFARRYLRAYGHTGDILKAEMLMNDDQKYEWRFDLTGLAEINKNSPMWKAIYAKK